MARTKNATRTPRRPGYKTEDILDPIPDELICNICTEVCRDPASCCSEGHDHCSDCLARWVREKGTCPMCREKVGVGKTLTKNRLGCAMVANLAVRCPEHAAGGAGGAGAGASAAGAGSGSAAAGGASGGGRSGDNARSDSTTIGERRGWGVAFGAPSAAAAEGCTWTGKLSEWDQHATVCRFVTVACKFGCGGKVQRHGIEDHEAACARRPASCADCEGKMPFITLSKHESKCPMKLVGCPGKCGEMILRKDVNTHLATTCPKVNIACPYRAQGCKVKSERGTMRKHVEEAQLEHATLIASHSAKCAADVQALAAENAALKKECAALQRTVMTLQTTVAGHGGQLRKCEQYNADGSTTMQLYWTIHNWPTAEEAFKRTKMLSSAAAQVGPHTFILQLELDSDGNVGIFLVLRPTGSSDLYPLDVGGTELMLYHPSDPALIISGTLPNSIERDVRNGRVPSLGFPKFCKLSDLQRGRFFHADGESKHQIKFIANVKVKYGRVAV